MIDYTDPGSPDAVHLAYRGATAGICGRSTGVLASDPGEADCPECDAAYVGIMHADSEREYLAMRAATLSPEALEQIKQATGWDGTPAPEPTAPPALDGKWPTWATPELYAERRRADFERERNGNWPADEEPSAFPDAPPVRTRADGSQEYGPYTGGWISGSCA